MTPQELITYFEHSCDEKAKLFVDDSPRQEKVARSLINFHKKINEIDILLDAIDLYIDSVNEAVLVFDFAIRAAEFRDVAKFEKQSLENFHKTMRETKIRMDEILGGEG
jgi:hypothetical protein